MVDPLIIGAGISAASSLLGGFLGSKSEKSATRNQVEQQVLDRQQQLDFAQQGIQWRVDDARQAGVHPLYSLGASIPTYSPVSQPIRPATAMSSGLAAAGQDIGRAVAATSTAGQRVQSAEMRQLQLRNAQLQNDMLSAQIGSLQASQIGPAFPSASPGLQGGIPGQGNDRITDQPQQRVIPHPDAMHSEPGAITDLGWARTRKGYAPVPSQDVKERIEDQIGPELYWMLRNYGPGKSAPPFAPPKGKEWRFSYTSGMWLPQTPRRFNKRKSLLRHEPLGTHQGPRRPAYRGRQFRRK